MSFYRSVRKYLAILSLFFVLVVGVHLSIVYLYEDSRSIPEKGGTVAIGFFGNAVSLSPFQFRMDGVNDFALRFLYRSMLRYDTETRTMQADVATCDLGKNFSEIKCFFKEGGKWSDGTPLTREDVIATYDFFAEYDGNKVLSTALAQVDVSEEGDAIVFRTDKPNPDLLDIFTVPIIRKDAIEAFKKGNMTVENTVYSGPYMFEKRESDVAHGVDRISLTTNPQTQNTQIMIAKYSLRFFADKASLLAAKDSLHLIYPDKRIDEVSSPRLARMNLRLPEYVMLFANTGKLNATLRSALMFQIGNMKLPVLPNGFGKEVKNPFGGTESTAPALDKRSPDAIMQSIGYFRKDALLSDAEKTVKTEAEKVAKPSATNAYFTSPTNKKSAVVWDTEDVLLSGKVPEGVAEVYINDYKLSGFKAGNTEFFYRAKTAMGNLKEGVNTYSLSFGYDGKKVRKESITLHFIRDAVEREKKQGEINAEIPPVVDAAKLAAEQTTAIAKAKEKYQSLDAKYYYDKSGKQLSVRLDYSSLSPEITTLAAEIEKNLDLIGVKVVLHEIQPGEIESAVKDGKKEYDLLLTGVNLGLLGYNIFPFFHSGQAEKGFNFSKVKDISLDVLLEELKGKDLGKVWLGSVRDKILAILRKESIVLTFYSPYMPYYLDRSVRGIRAVESVPYASNMYDILEPSHIKEERLADFSLKSPSGFIDWCKNLLAK